MPTRVETELAVVIDETESLTEWEADFIDSISEQLSNGKPLSARQEEILHKIYGKVV